MYNLRFVLGGLGKVGDWQTNINERLQTVAGSGCRTQEESENSH